MISAGKTLARRAPAIPLVPLCLVLAILALPARADQAKDLYKAGQAAETKKNYDLAYDDYRKAAELKPNQYDYELAERRAQFEASADHIHKGEQLRAQGKYQEAIAQFTIALSIDPSNVIAQQEINQINAILQPKAPQGTAVSAEAESELDRRLAEAAGPADLGPVSDTRIDLTLSNDSRIAFTTLGQLAHLNVIFDSEFKSQPVTLNLNQCTLLEALRVLDLEADAFYTVVTPNTVYVANDSTTKRQELDQMVVKTFYLHNLTKPQDLTEVVNAVRTLIPGQPRIQPVASSMAVIMRDTPDKVALAEKLFDDLDKAPPEVVVDVKVLQVNTDVARNLGLLPPNSTTISLNTTTTNETNSTTGETTSSTQNPTLSQLAGLNGSDFTATISSATLEAMLSDAETRELQEPQLRAVQGDKATLNIGQRIPVATGSFQPGIGGVGINPLVNTQFNYVPVGVNLELTPYIHDNSVTLDNKVEISEVDEEENIGGIEQPVIGQRAVEHTIELQDGESGVLAGVLENTVTHNISGVPGLDAIPGLGWLFSTHDDEVDHTELLIVMTPHIVRNLDLTRLNQEAIDTGTLNDLSLRELPPATAVPAPGGPAAANPAPTAATAAPATSPAATANPAALPPRGAALLQFSPALAQAAAGQKITVHLQASGLNNDFALALRLQYNPAVLQLQSVSDGGFLSQDGQVLALAHVDDAADGSSEISLSRPPNSGGESGAGTVVVLTFTAKAPGNSPLSLSRVVARDPGGAALSVQAESGGVAVH